MTSNVEVLARAQKANYLLFKLKAEHKICIKYTRIYKDKVDIARKELKLGHVYREL